MAKAEVVPTVTVYSLAEYNKLADKLAKFANRLHLDFADGQFAPRTIAPIESHWPEYVSVDFHLMYQRPAEQLSTVISMAPNLVIIHAEAEGELLAMMARLKELGIKAGVALLQATRVDSAAPLIEQADYVLIFSGNLGHYGGEFDASQLEKIGQIRSLNLDATIAWDGGISVDNIGKLVEAGVSILNVGGAIAKAPQPKKAYEKLLKAAVGK